MIKEFFKWLFHFHRWSYRNEIFYTKVVKMKGGDNYHHRMAVGGYQTCFDCNTARIKVGYYANLPKVIIKEECEKKKQELKDEGCIVRYANESFNTLLTVASIIFGAVTFSMLVKCIISEWVDIN
ncbi:hypothetical protein LCGC14_1499500 [marine sediment metagenome]|uniref:Uncharacterized protein n=1 Tax=marine sediment metagenome TaxID=412755 RepID=A0A0F9M5Y2_9ZZZZ|nr:hypothetical protein [Candidatus Scalindua sp.]